MSLYNNVYCASDCCSRPGSFRIGISGPPGVGKSTFIEALGLQLLEEQQKLQHAQVEKKVAVLVLLCNYLPTYLPLLLCLPFFIVLVAPCTQASLIDFLYFSYEWDWILMYVGC